MDPTHEELYRQMEAATAGASDPAGPTPRELAGRMADTLPRQENLNAFNRALDLLAYHGQTETLLLLLRQAWPTLQASPLARDTAQQVYATLGADVTIFHYLETHERPDAQDPTLLQALHHFFPIAPEHLADYLGVLTGRLGRPWELEHFRPLRAALLGSLVTEGLAYFRTAVFVDYTKGDLFRRLLPAYLLARAAGDLYPRPDVGDLMRRGLRPEPQPPPPEHPLCPDRITLENYLQRLTETVQARPHAAAAFVELLPAWLGFLQSRGLLSAEQAEKIRPEISFPQYHS